MEKTFLIDLGLSDDIADLILIEHLKNIQLQKETFDSHITTLKEENDILLQKKEAEIKALLDAAATSEKHSALASHLEADGLNPIFAKLILKEFDLNSIQLENGKILDWDNISSPIKATYPQVFGKFVEKGAPAATPPDNCLQDSDPFIIGFKST